MKRCQHCNQEVCDCLMHDIRTCGTCHLDGHQGAPDDCEVCYEQSDEIEPSRRPVGEREERRRARRER